MEFTVTLAGYFLCQAHICNVCVYKFENKENVSDEWFKRRRFHKLFSDMHWDSTVHPYFLWMRCMCERKSLSKMICLTSSIKSVEIQKNWMCEQSRGSPNKWLPASVCCTQPIHLSLNKTQDLPLYCACVNRKLKSYGSTFLSPLSHWERCLFHSHSMPWTVNITLVGRREKH